CPPFSILLVKRKGRRFPAQRGIPLGQFGGGGYMRTHPILILFWLAGALGAAVTQAQEAEAQAIANWPAPPLWSPPARAVRAAALGEKTSQGIAPLERETASAALPFVAIPPCRIVDTRGPAGPYGAPALGINMPRNFALPGGPCAGIPPDVQAYSL